jgi:hypothetical protein
VRAAVLDVVGVAGAEDPPFAIDGHFEPAADHDPALSAVMIALSPPLIVERGRIDDMVTILSDAMKRVA